MSNKDTLRTLRLAVAGAASGGLSFATKGLLTTAAPWPLAFLLPAIFFLVLFFDSAIGWIYKRSLGFRRVVAYASLRPFIEGHWLDVGVRVTGNDRQLMSCSFIRFTYADDAYEVSGTTWRLEEPGKAHPWVGEAANFDNRTDLTFWYQDEYSKTHGEASKVALHFKLGDWKCVKEFDGSYREHSQDVKTCGVRLDDKLVQSLSAHPTLASLLRQLHDSDTETASAIKRDLAKAYESRYAVLNRMKPPKYIASADVGQDYPIWYEAFLRYSDNKKQELDLVRGFTPPALPQQITGVLDIGPGNGVLSRAILKQLGVNEKTLRYTAVEPNWMFLEEIKRLTDESFGVPPRLVCSDFEDYLQWNPYDGTDVVLAAHSLYFCREAAAAVDSIFAAIQAQKVKCALLFHSDWKSDPLLDYLICNKNVSPIQDVIGRTAELYQKLAVKPKLTEVKGNLKLKMPSLTQAEWDQLLTGLGLNDPAKPRLRDAAQLICFLVAASVVDLMRAGRWEDIVQKLRSAPGNADTVNLPLSMQLYQK